MHIARDMQVSTKKGMTLMIDVWFDCRQDTNGKDPDQHSSTLKHYHAELWTKPLPDGRRLTMLDQERGRRLILNGYAKLIIESAIDHLLAGD